MLNIVSLGCDPYGEKFIDIDRPKKVIKKGRGIFCKIAKNYCKKAQQELCDRLNYDSFTVISNDSVEDFAESYALGLYQSEIACIIIETNYDTPQSLDRGLMIDILKRNKLSHETERRIKEYQEEGYLDEEIQEMVIPPEIVVKFIEAIYSNHIDSLSDTELAEKYNNFNTDYFESCGYKFVATELLKEEEREQWYIR